MVEMGDGDMEPSNGTSEIKRLSREDVMEMIRQRDAIENRIAELRSLLESQKQVGMTGSLLDDDGYPRSDIDVYSVRHARHDIICLNNDHQALMARIEKGLYALHAQAREEASIADEKSGVIVQAKSFARVSMVSPGSPAASAGLEAGDKIIVFGSANFENFKGLSDFATIVSNSENRSIGVEVNRDGSRKRFTVIPKRWSGPGLLGCTFVEHREG